MNIQYMPVVDSLKAIVISLSKDYKIMDLNREAQRYYEMNPEDVIGKQFLKYFIPKENHEVIQEILQNVVDGISTNGYEILIKTRNNREFIIQWTFSRLIDNEDQFIGMVALGQDITPFKIKEKKLMESEENYKIFLQNFQGIAYQAYLDTFKPRLFIGKVKEITGYTPEEFLEQKIRWDAIIHPDDQSKIYDESKKLVDNPNYVADNEYRIYQKNGNIKWVRDISLKVLDTRTKKKILQGSVFDISERKRIEQELEIQKALLESIFKAAPTGIGRVVDRVFTDVNDRFCDLVGYSREELLGESAKMVYPSEEDYNLVGKKKYNQIAKYGIGTVETRFKHKNGEVLDILLSSSPIDVDDLSKGVTFTALDITNRNKIEKDLRNERNLFKQITLTSPAGISVINKEGEIVFANTQAEKVLGLTRDQITKRTYNEPSWRITHYDGSPYPDKDLPFQKVKNEKKAFFDIRHAIEHPNGERIFLSINAAPLLTREGNFNGMIATVEDITRKILVEQKLKDSEERYRQAYNRVDFYKDLFAHDINNILHNILMGIQLNYNKLKELGNIDKYKENYQIIREQVNRGAKLVSNIRKISQIEEEEIHIKPIEIIAILNNSITFVKKSFKYKTLFIKCETELKEICINGNEFVQEIFDNILINAIKFTTNTNILIKIIISKVLIDNKNYYKMQFIDNGIGIPDSIKKKIFVRSNHKSKAFGGMGLGLSLVKKIVESYHGEIWVEDKIKGDSSQGSNFIVLFPEIE
ncbi:MAG: PAS domain S-box protein [Promethearchaeota archaeon]